MKVRACAALLLLCLATFAADQAAAWPASTPAPAPEAAPPQPSTAPKPTPAPSKPGIAAADDLVIAVDATRTIRIPHLEVAGSTLTGSDIVALFALKDAKAIEARLRTLDATSVDIPEITGDSTDGGTTYHWSLRRLHLADLKAGRAASASLEASSFSAKDDKDTTTFATGAVAAQGLALAQFAHLAAASIEAREALSSLFDSLHVAGVTLTEPAGGEPFVAVASIEAAGVKARPFVKRPAKPTPDEENLAKFHDLADAVAIDSVSVDGIAFSPDGAAGGTKDGAIDHVAMRGLADGRAARCELRGLAITAEAQKIGRVTLTSAAFDGVGANAAMPSVDRIQLDGLSVDAPYEKWGKDARLKFSLAHSAYEAPGLVIGKLPAKATLTVEHLVMDMPPQVDGASALTTMGYKTVDLSSRIVSRYDPVAQTLSLDPLSISAADMGTLDLKLDLSHVAEAIVSQNETLQQVAAAAIKVNSLDVSLRNEGLADKLLAFVAAGDGRSLPEVRETTIAKVDLLLVALGLQDSAKAKLIADALRSFLADPKSLHLGLEARNGLGLEAVSLIGTPQALLDTLDVRADANR